MRCSRCGASAVVTRGQDYFCGRCALAHDWEEIIAIAQEATVTPAAPPAPPPPAHAAASV
ncbi:MAG: hypothetical protein MUE66_06080 [Acidimicrobiia bacterium]|jgi:hypothetical protein|nr:hypothetical protein [Acidimicrobiia bacterium]